MQTRLYALDNNYIKRLDLKPVVIKKEPYLTLFPQQNIIKDNKVNINNNLNKNIKIDYTASGEIKQSNDCKKFYQPRRMDKDEILKNNVFNFDYKKTCDNDLLIKFGKQSKKKF